MAKIFIGVFCFLLFCACHNNRVPEAGVILPDSVTNNPTEENLPTYSDTTFADTATAVIDTLVVDTVIKKEETQIIVVVPETKSLQSIYTKFIGVREKTGNNDGPEVEMFLRSVGLGKGYAWCAAFVKYCMLEAGVKAAEKMNGMALSTENKKNFIYHNGELVKKPQAGDVFTLYYARLGRIGHTGFFDREINSSVFETVEGNTNNQNSREGDGVYRRKRSYNSTFSISRWQ